MADRVADSSRQYDGAAIPHSITARVTAGGVTSVQSGHRRARSGHAPRACGAAGVRVPAPRLTSVPCPYAIIPYAPARELPMHITRLTLPFLSQKKGIAKLRLGQPIPDGSDLSSDVYLRDARKAQISARATDFL